MINYIKVLSYLQAEDHLFLLNERPHDLAWCQFTYCDKAHEGVIHLQDILYLCKKKKLEFFMQTLVNQHQVFIFIKSKQYIMILYPQKNRKKRGS